MLRSGKVGFFPLVETRSYYWKSHHRSSLYKHALLAVDLLLEQYLSSKWFLYGRRKKDTRDDFQSKVTDLSKMQQPLDSLHESNNSPLRGITSVQESCESELGS